QADYRNATGRPPPQTARKYEHRDRTLRPSPFVEMVQKCLDLLGAEKVDVIEQINELQFRRSALSDHRKKHDLRRRNQGNKTSDERTAGDEDHACEADAGRAAEALVVARDFEIGGTARVSNILERDWLEGKNDRWNDDRRKRVDEMLAEFKDGKWNFTDHP